MTALLLLALATIPITQSANDECATALPISAGSVVDYDLTAATSSLVGATACTSQSVADVWFEFIPTQDGSYRASIPLVFEQGAVGLEIHRGSCGALERLGCDTAGGGFVDPSVVFGASAGQTIYVRVLDLDVSVSVYDSYVVQLATAGAGPSNDDCNNPRPLLPSTSTSYLNPDATDSFRSMSCGFNGDPGSEKDLWFSYHAASSCSVTVDTFSSDFDTILEVFDGTCSSLVSLACNDDAPGGGTLQSEVVFHAVAGLTYRIQAGSFQGATGSGVITVSESGAGIGELVCDGVINSTGRASRVCVVGSAVAADNDLAFEVTGLPGNANGFFVNSRTATLVTNPGGSTGNLCIASFAMGRHPIVTSNMQGQLIFSADLTTIPNNTGANAALAGDTWYWQFWHRDTDVSMTATSNFSSAIQMLFE